MISLLLETFEFHFTCLLSAVTPLFWIVTDGCPWGMTPKEKPNEAFPLSLFTEPICIFTATFTEPSWAEVSCAKDRLTPEQGHPVSEQAEVTWYGVHHHSGTSLLTCFSSDKRYMITKIVTTAWKAMMRTESSVIDTRSADSPVVEKMQIPCNAGLPESNRVKLGRLM